MGHRGEIIPLPGTGSSLIKSALSAEIRTQRSLIPLTTVKPEMFKRSSLNQWLSVNSTVQIQDNQQNVCFIVFSVAAVAREMEKCNDLIYRHALELVMPLSLQFVFKVNLIVKTIITYTSQVFA